MSKLLTTFQAVYEARSFSRAAETLFLSQPTVSNQIKQLERELNIGLFQRNGRKEMLPTRQADLLCERTLALLKEWEETQQKLLNEQNEEEVCRTIASHTSAVYLLLRLTRHLIKRFPKVHFEIKTASSRGSPEQVAKREPDFGFIEKSLEASGVQRYPLTEDQLAIAGDPKSKLWLIRETNSGVFHYTQRYFEEVNIQDKKMIVKSNNVIITSLKEGIGRSILSGRLVSKDVPTIPLDFHRYLYFIQRINLVSNQLLEVVEEVPRYNKSTEASRSEENLS